MPLIVPLWLLHNSRNLTAHNFSIRAWILDVSLASSALRASSIIWDSSSGPASLPKASKTIVFFSQISCLKQPHQTLILKVRPWDNRTDLSHRSNALIMVLLCQIAKAGYLSVNSLHCPSCRTRLRAYPGQLSTAATQLVASVAQWMYHNCSPFDFPCCKYEQ